MMIELNFSPRPVRVIIPSIIPAAAQVEPTLTTPIEPPLKAPLSSFLGVTAVSFRIKLITKETTVAQKTAMIGVYPMSMITAMATGEVAFSRKRNPPASIRKSMPVRRIQGFVLNYLILSPFSVKYRMAPG